MSKDTNSLFQFPLTKNQSYIWLEKITHVSWFAWYKSLIYYTSTNAMLYYNFSMEHYVLPEDDLRNETCKSLLNVLVWRF